LGVFDFLARTGRDLAFLPATSFPNAATICMVFSPANYRSLLVVSRCLVKRIFFRSAETDLKLDR
jgi:hypothetical protein